MKILCMLPAGRGVYPEDAVEERARVIRGYCTAGTTVDWDYMPGVSGFNPWGQATMGDPSPEAGARAAAFAVERAQQAEREGYDAFCPFGTRDVGVREARQVVKIPVVGQTEACMLFCAMLDRRFATVAYMPGAEARFTQWAVEAGAGHLLAANTAIGIPNSEYAARRADLLVQFVRCAAEARARGAEVMGLVAMSICPTTYSAAELSAACGMPVLDAMACQIGLAEMWHRTGLPPALLRMPRGKGEGG